MMVHYLYSDTGAFSDHHEHGAHSDAYSFSFGGDWAGLLLLLLCIGVYVAAALTTHRHHRSWPLHRYLSWTAGILCVMLSVAGPLARSSHQSFQNHMLVHLLLGMLAPILIAYAKPVTLLLLALPVPSARKLSRLLRSKAVHMIVHPWVAAIWNIGGMWLLYMTDLFHLMNQYRLLYAVIHFHLFAAGYQFTISILYIDLTSRRHSFRNRAITLILAAAGHSILSKAFYAYPPVGVPREAAEQGGMLMYYGGGAIELVLMFALCAHWFKSVSPSPRSKKVLHRSGIS
ncbi:MULTISPECIES: cytochrome c oxidase assembly protein [Paenibacillus]|uniref:cytochrome c oxidase assembly protein n=2 Tax=Bacillati TaxID=1783272 RepID=UPI00119E86A2|nr:cytochrome c oxidase assembly protein [Paenibacillus sp. IHBB 10380]